MVQQRNFSPEEMKHYSRFEDLAAGYNIKLDFESAYQDYMLRSAFSRLVTPRPVDRIHGISSESFFSGLTHEADSVLDGLNSECVGKDGHRYGTRAKIVSKQEMVGDLHAAVSLDMEFADHSRGECVRYSMPLSWNREKNVETAAALRNEVLSDSRLSEPSLFVPVLDRLNDTYAESEFLARVPQVLQGQDPRRGTGRTGEELATMCNESIVAGVDRRDFVNEMPRRAREEVFDLRNAERVVIQEHNEQKDNGRKRSRLVSGYVMNRLGELSTRDVTMEMPFEKQYEKAMFNDAYVAANMKADTALLYQDARCPVGHERKWSVTELKQLSIAQSAKDPDTGKSRDKEFANHFVANMLDAGYPREVIEESLDNIMKERGSSFRPAYDVIEKRQSDAYVTMIVEQTETDYGKGIRDAAKVEIKTPEGILEDRFTKVNEVKEAKAFMSQHQIDRGDRSAGERLGGLMCSHGADFSFASAAEASGINVDSIMNGYMDRMTDEYIARRDNGKHSPSVEASVPAKILRDDIMAGADGLIAEGKKQEAGRFLHDAGVKFGWDDLCAGACIYAAAARMYGKGDENSVANVTWLREKYKEVMNQIKKFDKEASKVAKNVAVKAVLKNL